MPEIVTINVRELESVYLGYSKVWPTKGRELEDLVNAGIQPLYNVNVTVKPYGLPSYDALALFEREYAEAAEVGGYSPRLSGTTENLDPDGCINERTEVWIEGLLYRVANAQPDGAGFVVWYLEKDPEL